VLCAAALEGLPEVQPGDDLGALIAAALRRSRSDHGHLSDHPHRSDHQRPDDGELAPTDVVVIAHKVVSKAEGRTRALSAIEPSPRAVELAREHGKDPRHVQVVLDESREVLRAANGVLICVTHHGFVCANAGVDVSNVPDTDQVVLLPRDPDASARALRARLQALLGVSPAIVVTDSFGRAWRHGQSDAAIGCAGLSPLEDWRGRTDAVGRELHATWIAVADELAGAADLARTKDGSEPVVIVRGAGRHVSAEDGPGAAAMVRPKSEDLFR
jgi:coenzyme F420-0:L-glutamate ligase/coenzyme F420-1:gamma-L-glutamate ligase